MILGVLSDFFLLREPNLKLVVTGTILLCAIAGFVGCFTFLRKRSLSGDVVAHSVLPGICLAFILSGEKNSFVLMLGALITGLLSLGMMEWISRRRIARPDTALSLMLSGFFGLGIVLLTYIQHEGNAAQPVRRGSAARVSITWRTIGRPHSGCSTVGSEDRIRVPSPAARTTADRGL